MHSAFKGEKPLRYYIRPMGGGGDMAVGDASMLRFLMLELITWRPGEPAKRTTIGLDSCREIPNGSEMLHQVVTPRKPFAGIPMDHEMSLLMGIVNTTPDSFSDGGRSEEESLDHALTIIEEGATIVDVGGESTRPGASPVKKKEELQRVLPVIEGLKKAGVEVPISIDTRKAKVAKAALEAGATIVNDVSAMTYDSGMLEVVKQAEASVILVHSKGDPETMQDDPVYEEVSLEVYDWLETRVQAVEAAGVPRSRIAIDPGIGFGKTIKQNLQLIRDIAMFHALGCVIVLGASRKGFVGKIASEPRPERRLPGSIATATRAKDNGVQIIRVHDVAETAQAFKMWDAMSQGGSRIG